MSFDLNTLALKDTYTLQLLHPVTREPLFADGETAKKPVEIELYGSASKQYRNAVKAMQNRQLKRKLKKVDAKAEELIQEGIDLLVACSAGANNLDIAGRPVGDEASFRALYADPKLSWVKDQVDEAVGDVANFLEQ